MLLVCCCHLFCTMHLTHMALRTTRPCPPPPPPRVVLQAAAEAGNTAAGKKKGGKAAGMKLLPGSNGVDGGSTGVVPIHVGEGDALSHSSSVLQDNWELVLQLATDTGAGGGEGDSAGAAAQHGSPAARLGGGGAAVRRRVVELIEVVIRWELGA